MTGKPTTPDPAAEQTLTDFRDWMWRLTPAQKQILGIDSSIEEPMRLLRAYATEHGLTLGPAPQ